MDGSQDREVVMEVMMEMCSLLLTIISLSCYHCSSGDVTPNLVHQTSTTKDSQGMGTHGDGTVLSSTTPKYFEGVKAEEQVQDGKEKEKTSELLPKNLIAKTLSFLSNSILDKVKKMKETVRKGEIPKKIKSFAQSLNNWKGSIVHKVKEKWYNWKEKLNHWIIKKLKHHQVQGEGQIIQTDVQVPELEVKNPIVVDIVKRNDGNYVLYSEIIELIKWYEIGYVKIGNEKKKDGQMIKELVVYGSKRQDKDDTIIHESRHDKKLEIMMKYLRGVHEPSKYETSEQSSVQDVSINHHPLIMRYSIPVVSVEIKSSLKERIGKVKAQLHANSLLVITINQSEDGIVEKDGEKVIEIEKVKQ